MGTVSAFSRSIANVKTARFTKVVEKSGKPRVHVSWTSQEKDEELKRALKENRVLSVHAETKGGGKSFGTVGLHAEAGTQLFIFPKSIRAFQDEKIVGINFDLLADANEENPPAKPKVSVAKRKPEMALKKTIGKKSAKPATPEPKPEPEKIAAVAESITTKAPHTPSAKKEAVPARPVFTLSLQNVLTEVARATKELKSGKTVAAYERLEKIRVAAKAKDPS